MPYIDYSCRQTEVAATQAKTFKYFVRLRTADRLLPIILLFPPSALPFPRRPSCLLPLSLQTIEYHYGKHHAACEFLFSATLFASLRPYRPGPAPPNA